MQPVPPPSPGRVIFREGLIFGVLLGMVHSALYFLSGTLLAQSGLSLLGFLLIVFLWLGVFFWAGVRGAKQTGRVGTGSLTGLVAAVFAGVIAFIALMLYASMNMPAISDVFQNIAEADRARGVQVTYTTSSIMVLFAACGTVLLLLGIGMGAAMGALGGLLGRSQSTVPPPMHPGYPPAYGYGYGPVPMQPLYPPPYAAPYQPPYAPPYQNQPPRGPDQQ
jgi:hypothetical protein